MPRRLAAPRNDDSIKYYYALNTLNLDARGGARHRGGKGAMRPPRPAATPPVNGRGESAVFAGVRPALLPYGRGNDRRLSVTGIRGWTTCGVGQVKSRPDLSDAPAFPSASGVTPGGGPPARTLHGTRAPVGRERFMRSFGWVTGWLRAGRPGAGGHRAAAPACRDQGLQGRSII